jgi:microsomal prostaglandin-E synthase 2
MTAQVVPPINYIHQDFFLHPPFSQYEVCPFCCKVKAALDFYKVPYSVIEVNPLTSAELKWAGLKKVPVVKIDDQEVMVESSRIMSRIAAEVESKAGGSKLSAKAKAAAVEREVKWRKWVDERFVKIITANIYRSWDETWNTFKYITDQTNWSWGTRELARVSGAVIMWQVGKKMPKKYNIDGDLREALYASCNEFVEAMEGKPFMGGLKPDLSDLVSTLITG